MHSSSEIVSLRQGDKPEKIYDEGDSLGIQSKVSTHSFYWSSEPGKEHDYEPIAFSPSEGCYFSRLHYHGLVLWKDYVKKSGKGIAYFLPLFHTPQICSKIDPFWIAPNDLKSKMALEGYFLPCFKANKLNNGQYEISPYSCDIIKDNIPQESKFLWKDFFYYVIFSSVKKIDQLKISEGLKKLLHDIEKSTS